jgi:hypothetical protein
LGIGDFERTEKVARGAVGKRVSNPKPKRPNRSSYRRRGRAASAAIDPRQLSFRFDEPEEP